MNDSLKKKTLISNPKTKTQRAALEILNKEEINAKRSRLECLLLQQFQAKYGTASSSIINDFIKTTVREFISSFDNVLAAEAMVGELESTIREGAVKIKNDIKSKKMSQLQEEQNKLEQIRHMSRNSFSEGKSNDSSVNIEGNQWPVINAILAVSDEQTRQKQAREAAEKKAKFQEDLRRQIDSNKSRLMQEQQEKQSTLEKNKAVLASYEMEMQHEKMQKELNFKSERSMRLGQIQERKEIKELERQQRIAIEQAEMARARRMAIEEEEAKRVRKEEQKKQQDLLFVENEKNKALKYEMQLQKQEYEKKLNRDYEAKLEREELARVSAFKARLDALDQSAKKYELKVGNKMEEEKRERMQVEVNQIKEKDQQDLEKEKNKQDKRKNDLMQSTMYNQTMVEKKRMEKEQERLEALERKSKMEKDSLEARRKEKELSEQKKLKMMELKMTLDEQVNRKHSSDQQTYILSETEKLLNKSIIKKLNEDPKLLEKVVERVNPAPRSWSRGSGNNIF